MKTSRWPISHLPISGVTPFTYRDGETYLSMLNRLAQYVTEQLHPNLRETVEQMVEEMEHILAAQHGKYVEGIQDFQRIHDAFMVDVNSALMALNDNAVSDLANNPDTTLGTTLRELFANNEQMLEYQDQVDQTFTEYRGQLDDQFTAFEQNMGEFSVNVTLPPYNAVAGDDVTEIINQALSDVHDRGGGTVMIPPADQPYYVDAVEGLHVLSNTVFDIRPGAVIKALPNDAGTYGIVKISNRENVTITGGGTIEGERHQHTGTSGEWGNGVDIRGGRNILVENVTITQCWGDGVYIGRGSGSTATPTNVHVRNTTLDDHRRQGVSIIRGENLHIQDNTITRIDGTNPMAGIDIEPNEGDHVEHVFITGNRVDEAQWGVILQGRMGTVERVNITNNMITTIEFAAIRLSRSDHNIVENNRLQNIRMQGIRVDGSQHNVVTNNVGESLNTRYSANPSASNVFHGIELYSSDGVESIHNTIRGNTIIDNATSGIRLRDRSQYNTIAENTITSCYEGVVLYDHSSHNIVESNVIDTMDSRGIWVLSTDRDNPMHHVDIHQNIIRDAGGTGLQVSVGDNITIRNNTLRGGHGIRQLSLMVTYDCSVMNNVIRLDGGTAETGVYTTGDTHRAFIVGNDALDSGVVDDILMNARSSIIQNNRPAVEA